MVPALFAVPMLFAVLALFEVIGTEVAEPTVDVGALTAECNTVLFYQDRPLKQSLPFKWTCKKDPCIQNLTFLTKSGGGQMFYN